MILSVFCDPAPRGALFQATEVANGHIDEKLFAIAIHPDGVVVRHQGSPTMMVRFTELIQAVAEAAATDESGWSPMMQATHVTNRTTGERLEVGATGEDEVWANNLYTVHVRREARFVHLSIHRYDKEPARDWRHFQRIKNEIVGPEFEAVELYPAESRMVDQANQYHLWVLLDETGGATQLEIGFHQGRVVATPEEIAEVSPGARQRPFEEAPCPSPSPSTTQL